MMFDDLNASATPMWGVPQAQTIDDTNYQLCLEFEIRKAGSSKLNVQFSKYILSKNICVIKLTLSMLKKHICSIYTWSSFCLIIKDHN
jgi:hypothetical protein